MHKLTMIFLTQTEGTYFTMTVDNIKADENDVPTVPQAQVQLP